MKTKMPTTYSIYQHCYEDEMPAEQYYIAQFDQLPSKFEHDNDFTTKIVSHFEKLGFVQEMQINITSKRYNTSQKTLFVHKEKQLMVGFEMKHKDNKELPFVSIVIYYNIKLGAIQSQLAWDALDEYILVEKKSNISLVKSDRNGMEIEAFIFNIPPMDLAINYGKNFMRTHDIIINRLNNKNDKGFFAFWGEPGTGKSTYIKYLTSIVEEKEILFIPPSMAEMLSEPSIIPFLMNHKNSILIIEDAERVISDRQTSGSPTGVSNILNLTDGILGECLNIQIIATFNMDRERIDPALLRKGRLVAEHKFDKLTVEESNRLLKHIGKDIKVNEPMCLADLYNIDSDYIRTTVATKKIGFFN